MPHQHKIMLILVAKIFICIFVYNFLLIFLNTKLDKAMMKMIQEILRVSKENSPQQRPAGTVRVDKPGNTSVENRQLPTPTKTADDSCC